MIETAVVVVGTLAAMLLGVAGHFTTFVGRFVAFHPYPGADLVDLGPGLLVLGAGLGVIAYRRWLDSERERRSLTATQAELVETRERYRSLVEVAPDPILVGIDGKIAFANPAAVSFFRAESASDLLGTDFLSRLPSERRAEAHAIVADILRTGEGASPIESYLLRLDGSEADAETSIVPMRYEGREAIQAVVRDLSARHAADEAMTRYHALAENADELVFFAAPDGRIVDVNRAAILKYGYTRAEFATMTVMDLRAPGVTIATGVDRVKQLGETARFDMVHSLKDGSIIELAVSAERVTVGQEELVISVARDVTAEHTAERALRASEQHYRSLIELSPVPIVVYDESRLVVFANQATLELLHATDISQVVGRDARRFIHPECAELGRIGRERLERDGSTPATDIKLLRVDSTSVSVQMSTSRTSYDGVDAVQVVLQDVSHRKDIADTLRKTTQDTISAMARLAETRDPYTSGHQERVAAMAERIARRMGLPEATCDAIRTAGIVHDIGKISVPAEILSKPGRLTETEFELIKTHAQRGYDLLEPIDFPWPIAEIVRQHHERLDGSGYPRGLRNGDIRIEARVLAVADTVEAISSDRPYRPAVGLDFALTVIREGRGTLYDPLVVDACAELAAESLLLTDEPAATVVGLRLAV